MKSSNKSTCQTELQRILQGDEESLTRWFHSNQQQLYAFIFFRVGRDPNLAEELTQSTFALALERLDRFDSDRGAMSTWLCYLSRNLIRKSLVEKQRGVQLLSLWDHIDADLQSALSRIEDESLPEEVLIRHETQDLVAMTLTNLPDHYRELLHAKYVDSLSLSAIAKVKNVSVDSVKSMLKRARNAFRECFLVLAKLELSDV